MFVTQDDRWKGLALDGVGASAQPHPCLTVEEKKRTADEMIGPQREGGIGRPEPVGERQKAASVSMTFSAPEAHRANRTAASEALPGRMIRLAWWFTTPRPDARDNAPRLRREAISLAGIERRNALAALPFG
jgi:hypothetical protein